MINSRMEDFYNRPYVNAVAQMEMRKDVQYVGKQLLWAMTTDDTEDTRAHIQEVTTYAKNVRANLELLQNNFANAALISRLETAVTNLGAIRDTVADLASANQNAEALEIYNDEYNDATVELQNVLMEIGTFADDVAASSYAQANTLGIVATVIMIAMGIISVAFCTYIGMLITKSIQRPVAELEKAAEKLSKGELDAEIVYESKDELGNLANSFRTAFNFMKDVISDTDHMLGEIAAGNFQVQSEKRRSIHGRLLRSFEIHGEAGR